MNDTGQPERLEITFVKGTDVGRARDHNEDYLDAFSPPDPAQRSQKGDLFIVADGMGGHQAGDVASQTAVNVISHEYYANPELDVRAALTSAIKKANAFIYQEAEQDLSRAGMGTTVVAAVIRGRELYLANVGDSRAYLMRGGKVVQATRDHSFVAEQVRAGLLTLEEARAHPQRNVITRALGSRPEVKVDTYSGELQAGDVLLLCTDGLSEYVHEDDMQTILGQYPPEEAVPRLIALANSRGGSDNISTIVIQVGPRPLPTRTQPLASPTQPIAAPPRRRRLWPWVLGVALGLGIVGALAAGGLLLLPAVLRPEQPTAVPVVTSPPTAAPTEAPTPSVPPTVTPMPTAAITGTPAVFFDQWQPEDGATVPPGPVTFSWRVSGLTALSNVVVRTETQPLCQGAPVDSCEATLAEGDYTWWLEFWVSDFKVRETERRVLHVTTAIAETGTVTPTLELAPTGTPTATISAETGSTGG